MAYINPMTKEIYDNLKVAPICYSKNCDDCPMMQVAYDHGTSVYTDRGMKCQDLCEMYPDEVARAFGYQEFDTSGMLKTLDGHYLKPIQEISNTMNTMVIYEIIGPQGYHKYLLASGKYSEWYITNHSIEDLRRHIMPQHYECIVDTELEAVRIAYSVAMESIVEFSNIQIKTAMDALEEIKKETKRILNQNLSYMEVLNHFWDNQDAMRKD